MTIDGLPLSTGTVGEGVRDLQQRLAAAGHETGDELGSYGDLTEVAVRRFQAQRRLAVDGICGRDTWAALIEAGFDLGDRLLYLRRPMLRGDDVSDLQFKLAALGFDAGRVDGIFGPQTEAALKDFQRNAGLTTDGVCGPDVLSGLARLGSKTGQPGQVAGIRERDRLNRAPRHLVDQRIVVGNLGGLDVPAQAVARALRDAGATVLVLDHPDRSVQAAEANAFVADLYLGLCVSTDERPHAAYYATTGFESIGGRHLARLLEHQTVSGTGTGTDPLVPTGMRIPVLRETRMPAVVCQLTAVDELVERHPDLARSITHAIERWVVEPVVEPVDESADGPTDEPADVP